MENFIFFLAITLYNCETHSLPQMTLKQSFIGWFWHKRIWKHTEVNQTVFHTFTGYSVLQRI